MQAVLFYCLVLVMSVDMYKGLRYLDMKLLVVAVITILISSAIQAQEVTDADKQTPDPSDPTRIDTRAGAGYKYTDFTGGAVINEIRAKLALLQGTSGMFVVDIGVGKINDNPNGEDETGLTDGRFRYFHLGPMDFKKMGYRGWGMSAELQTQGTVPGTDGSNLFAVGAIWSFKTTSTVSIFPNIIGSAVWSNDFDSFLGVAARGDLFITWKPEGIWRGGYLKLKPSYSYGVSGDINGSDSASLEVAVGGMLSKDKKWWWDIQGRGFGEDELEQEIQGPISSEWSAYVSFTFFM